MHTTRPREVMAFAYSSIGSGRAGYEKMLQADNFVDLGFTSFGTPVKVATELFEHARDLCHERPRRECEDGEPK